VLVIGAVNLLLASLQEVAKPEWILRAQFVSTLRAVTVFALVEFAFVILDSVGLVVIKPSIVPEMSPTNQRQLISVVFAEETELLASVAMENCMVPSTTPAVFVEEMELHASILAKISVTALLALKILLVDTARGPRNVSRLTLRLENALTRLPLIACRFLNLF